MTKPVRAGAVSFPDLFLPSSGMKIGDIRLIAKRDPNGNIDFFLAGEGGREVNLTGEALLARATASLTLTTSYASITGDGDSSKVRLLLPTIGEWLVRCAADLSWNGANNPGTLRAALFVNDSGTEESGDAVYRPRAQNSRITAPQEWKVITTVANTPIELKAKMATGGGNAACTSEHTTLTATIGAGGGSTVETTSHTTLTDKGGDEHPQYGQLADAETVPGLWDFTGGIKADVIAESTGATGVTIDTAKLKDSKVYPVAGDANMYFGKIGGNFYLQADTGDFIHYNVSLNKWYFYSGNAQRFTVSPTTITSALNHDFSAGIDVTGDITVTGTVDGVDIAARDHAQAHAAGDHSAANIMPDANQAYTGDMGITGALTATSYGGITEANLVDKTATEVITGVWTLPITALIHRAHAQAYKSGNQSINDATETILTFDSEHLDNDGIHDNSTNNARLTATRAGVYRVNAQVIFAANSTNRRRIQFYKGAGVCPGFCQHAASPVGFSGIQATVLLPLAAGEFMRCAAYQDSGGALNVIGGADATIFEMELVSEA